MKDCPFPIYYAAATWKGCKTEFWEGVRLAKKVLHPDVIDNASAQGNTPFSEALITEAVAVLREREAARIEDLRSQLVEYDAFRASDFAPGAPEPEPEQKQDAQAKPAKKEKA